MQFDEMSPTEIEDLRSTAQKQYDKDVISRRASVIINQKNEESKNQNSIDKDKSEERPADMIKGVDEEDDEDVMLQADLDLKAVQEMNTSNENFNVNSKIECEKHKEPAAFYSQKEQRYVCFKCLVHSE